MLQFWKRSGHNDKIRPSNCISTNDSNKIEIQKSSLLLEKAYEFESLFNTLDVSFVEKSRLSKSLEELLRDKEALVYFIHYLESESASCFIRCWLDIEAFKTSVKLLEQDDCIFPVDELKTFSSPFSRTDHDSLSISTDCDSLTADSNSLFEYSTHVDGRAVADLKLGSKSADEIYKPPSQRSLNVELKSSGNVYDGSEMLSSSPSEKMSSFSKDGVKSRRKIAQDLVADAVSIFKKYISQDAMYPIGCDEDIRKRTVESICSNNGHVDPDCLNEAQQLVINVLRDKYFDKFRRSGYYCKHQVDLLTSGSVTLEDILYNETALFYFMEFLQQEDQNHLLEFWIAGSNFRQHFDPDEAKQDAISLYDKFFSLEATHVLGFGDKVRSLIEENICTPTKITSNCFNVPLKILEEYLRSNYFPMFLNSELFFRYLSELINTFQNSCKTQAQRTKSISSDCGSEMSTKSSNNPINIPNTKIKTNNMVIETEQLYNPDALWKRRVENTELRFGVVNPLGKFKSELEPEPDSKSRLRIARLVKDFVGKEEKAKEEMAWQVAEMIIKDITSVTMSNVNKTQS